jgi:hypothetical protein
MLSEGNLKIQRVARGSVIPNDELFDLWTLMLRGPVTRKKLSGRAYADAYYLFPILRELPYIRAIELQPRGSVIPAVAMELDDETESREAIAAGGAQGELAWQ